MTITVDTTSVPGTSIINDASGIIDYSSYYARIATSVETLATNSTAIKTAVETLATNSTAIKTAVETLATNSTDISVNVGIMTVNSNTITNLATGTGIHYVGPYDWLGLINVYRAIVEQGGALDSTGNVPPDKQAEAMAAVVSYIEKIQSFPTGFQP